MTLPNDLTHCACKSDHCGYSDTACPTPHPEMTADGVDSACASSAGAATLLGGLTFAGLLAWLICTLLH